MEKILFDFQSYGGGAPKSHLSHANILTKKGFDVVLITGVVQHYYDLKKMGYEVYLQPNFKKNNFLKNIKNLFSYYKLIKNINPHLVYTNRTNHNLFLSVICDYLRINHLCARAGGGKIPSVYKANRDRVHVLYSEENYRDLVSLGFNKENLFIIKNRIKCEYKQNALIKRDNVRILIIGNLYTDTYHDTIILLNKLFDNIDLIYSNVNILICGEIVDKCNLKEKKLYHIINSINKTSNSIKVEYIGWVDNLDDYINNADICIGKGRSIIQPGIMGKIPFVLSKNGKILCVQKENYIELSRTNFTGRGFDNFEDEFDLLLNCIKNKIEFYNNFTAGISGKLHRDYSIDYLEDKIIYVINYIFNNQNFKKSYYSIIRLFNIYILKVISKFNA